MANKLIRWTAAAAATGAGLLLLDAMFLEKYFFQVKRFAIGEQEGTEKIRLLLLTDLHIKKRLWPYYKKLASTVNKLSPDLILITGDTLDGHSCVAPVDAFLGLLRHDIQKVAILGNHDHFDEIPVSALAALYQKHNCRLLVNETISCSVRQQRLVITGLDDFIESNSCVVEALQGTGWEKHHLLLIHSPLQQESVLQHLQELNAKRSPSERVNIRYIFAGHNHGGQVRFLNLVPKLPIMAGRYVEGWYNRAAPYLYVSKGFGTSTLPFRFGARAEVTVFEYYC
jgi:predicted MPP superfamily phosphohydrolase